MPFRLLFPLHRDLFFCNIGDTVYFTVPVNLIISVIQWPHYNQEDILLLFLRGERE